MAEYTRLQRTDLTTFDKEATTLVLEAMDYGWLGRISSKNHAILRAPDGQTTISVSRDSLRGRSGRNCRAQFDRWLKEHTDPAPTPKDVAEGPVDPRWEPLKEAYEKIEAEGTEPVLCKVCGQEFPSASSLASHKRKHSMAARPRVECPLCGERYTVLGRHVQVHGQEAADVYALEGLSGLQAWVEKQEPPVDHAAVALDAIAALVEENKALREQVVTGLGQENERLREQVTSLESQLAKIKEALS